MHAPRPAHRAPRSLTHPLRGGRHQSLGRRGASRAALGPHTWTWRPLLFSAPSTRPDGVPAPFPISVPALLHERLPAWQVSSPGLQLPWDSQLSDPGIKAPAPARTPGLRQASFFWSNGAFWDPRLPGQPSACPSRSWSTGGHSGGSPTPGHSTQPHTSPLPPWLSAAPLAPHRTLLQG